jgi:hypothetical protein
MFRSPWTHQYPFKAEDFARLVNRNGIDKPAVQMAAEKKEDGNLIED